METAPMPTEFTISKTDRQWVESSEGTPIVDMSFQTREDGLQYARTEYQNGYVEFHERGEWLALGRYDFWGPGSLKAALDAAVREVHESSKETE